MLLLSTLDWALIETWRDAGVPLEAVLRGIDDAFDKYEARAARARGRLRKVNGLAWCAQSVMAATEAAVDAATGVAKSRRSEEATGLDSDRIATYLRANAQLLLAASTSTQTGDTLRQIAGRLEELAAAVPSDTESLERELTVLEEKIFAALTLAAPDAEIVSLREQAARELAPHRSKMTSAQIRQVTEQFVQKRLLQTASLPRLSLFYMDCS